MEIKKYGLMNYPEALPKYNLGDYIQGLAAKQYLPRVDYFINREGLSNFHSEKVKMIMNGFYMSRPSHWPPSREIEPLFVSMHINSTVKDTMLREEGIDYFKSLNQSIGCRDHYTEKLLLGQGVEAYYSGCLTTTLDLTFKSAEKRTDNIYIVDPFYYNPTWEKILSSKKNFLHGVLKGEIFELGLKDKLLRTVFSKELLESAIPITHWITDKTGSNEQRFAAAEAVLKKYASAKLVITSRIHCALPCLALGTPVIFLNYGLDIEKSISRLDGIIDLFNTINFNKAGVINSSFQLPENSKIDVDFELKNPQKHLKFANALKEKCKSFIEAKVPFEN